MDAQLAQPNALPFHDAIVMRSLEPYPLNAPAC